MLVVELRVVEIRPVRPSSCSDVQSDTGVAFATVPIAPVAFDVAQPYRQLFDGRFDLLDAQDIGLLAVDELLELCLPRPDPVDVPRRDFHAVQPTALPWPRGHTGCGEIETRFNSMERARAIIAIFWRLSAA